MQYYRTLLLGAVLSALAVSPAFAEAGSTLADFQYTREVLAKRLESMEWSAPDSPFSKISKPSRAWIKAETQRQIDNPRSVTEVAASVDTELQDEELKIAQQYRIDPMDITRVVTLLIMADAEDGASKALRKAKRSGDTAAIEASQAKLTQATANRKEAIAMQSEVSMALAQM